VSYRNIARPPRYTSMDTTDVWCDWLSKERLVLPVSKGRCCRVCHGAVGYGRNEEPYGRCRNCLDYIGALDALVPISYSVDDGLESLLHRYKDFGERYQWMAAPLASLTVEFLLGHRRCLETRAGSFDRALTVPSGGTSRGFDHLRTAIEMVDEWPIPWDFNVLTKAKPGRPPRGTADPSFYRLTQGASVTGSRILLFDDTWTSGATMASAAQCLRDHGAHRVVGLTVGRQLRSGWGTSDELISTARQQAFDLGRCVICG